MQSQRKHKRHKLPQLPQPTQVYNSIGTEYLGVLVNISLEGLLIMSDAGLKTDTLYQLTLKFPEPFCGVMELSLGVDCLWVDSASGLGQSYWSGCHIIDISESDSAALKGMLGTSD